MNQRLQRSPARRPQRHDSYVADLLLARIAAAADDDDFQRLVQLRQARVKMLAVGLDPADDVWNSTQANRTDFHVSCLSSREKLKEPAQHRVRVGPPLAG